MLDGMGEATAAVAPAVAFAFLADPRHAGEWFAGAGFETPPQGPARAGLEWSFARTPGTRYVQPVRMTVYEPPSRFIWETTFRSPLATNFSFEMQFAPVAIAVAPEPPADEAETDTSPSPPADTPAPVPATSVPGTRLRFTIRLRPGVVQWASVAAGFVLVRRALRERAQKAADRAAATVESAAAGPASRRGRGSQRGAGSRRRDRKRR